LHKVLPFDALNLPSTQAEHDCASLPPNPALQTQPEAPASEFEFNGQSEQAPFPTTDLNFPGMHDWH